MIKPLIKLIQSGGILGGIGLLTVGLFSGWSGAVIGWLFASVSAFITCQNTLIHTPQAGAKIGTKVGLGIGIWLLFGSLLEGLVIKPLSGQTALSFIQAFTYGIVALFVTLLSGTLIGAAQGIIGPKRGHATILTFAFIAIAFPFVEQITQVDWIATVISILIFVILALGLNIPVGFAGLLDLGYAAFFAIGAYTTGLLASSHLGFDWNFWIVLPIAAIISAIAGIILGTPTLPLKGDYLAIVTLGFGEIIPIVFRNLTSVRIDEPISKMIGNFLGHPEIGICLLGCEKAINLTGGEAGINPINRPSLPIIGTFASSNYFPWYYLILGLVIFSYIIISRLNNSRLGRAWSAMREDELAANAMGINIVKTKLLAFSMGATFSGFAGAFYAAYISAIFPSVFDFSVSVIILCMVILGGLGNMAGVILGAIIIMAADRLYLPQLAQVLKGFLNTTVLPNITNPQFKDFLITSVDPIQMRLFLFGLTLIIMMIVRPQGLVSDIIKPKVIDN